MFTRHEASRIKQEFWTTFGKYMSPIHSAEGLKINWINYHTRVKDLYFRMTTESSEASISISIEHRDAEVQKVFFDNFLELRQVLHETLQEVWTWDLHVQINEKLVTRIHNDLVGVSVYNKEHWPDLISFFKPRIIALDQFWETAKYRFDWL